MNNPSPKRPRTSSRHLGLTLLELVTVLAVLVVLAGMVVPTLSGVQTETASTATRHSLRQIQEVILHRCLLDVGKLPAGHASDALRANGTYPQLAFLFVNPDTYPMGVYGPAASFNSTTRFGWNGPYLVGSAVYPNPSSVNPNDAQGRTWNALGFTSTYGQSGDATVFDGWGNPIVLYLTSNVVGTVTYYSCYAASAGPDGVLNPAGWTYNADGSLASSDDDLALLIKMWN